MFQNLFNYDNPVWRFVGKLGDMIILNVLWVVCCIPIVTIGASTTALYYCTLKIVRDEENGNFRMFFKSFRENLVQSTIIWVIMGVAGIVLAFDLYFFTNVFQIQNQTVKFIAIAFTGAVLLVWFLILLYVFPIQSRFFNPVKRTFMNAFFMSIRHLGRTFLIILQDVGLLAVAVISLLYIPQIAGLCMLLGFPVIAWVNSYQFEKIFELYMPAEERADHSKPDETYLKPILEDETVTRNTAPAEKELTDSMSGGKALTDGASGEKELPGGTAGDEKALTDGAFGENRTAADSQAGGDRAFSDSQTGRETLPEDSGAAEKTETEKRG